METLVKQSDSETSGQQPEGRWFESKPQGH